jgi:hypothetical protein
LPKDQDFDKFMNTDIKTNLTLYPHGISWFSSNIVKMGQHKAIYLINSMLFIKKKEIPVLPL